MTVDGKIATENSSMKISGEHDLIRVHELRKKYDLHMTVERYKSDDTMPESDKSFIRE